MKNIKNILGMGAFMLLTSLAVSSCTEKSDWDIDSSYSRPFGTDENGISIETDSKVARAVVTWSSTSNTDYYIIEISPNEMTDETPMGSEENGNIVYGNDPANRIKQSPYTMDNLAVNTTYYMRIKSISGEKESRWVNYKKTFASVKEEAILCNDVGKQWIPAHRFAMGQHFAEYICFFFLFGRKVPHYLQDVFSTGFFYGGDRGNRNFNQIGNSLYSVIHFSDEHFIAVCKNERYRIFLLKSY